MRPHVALGTGVVDGTGRALALFPAMVWADAVIEAPSNSVGNATAATANAFTAACLFMAPPRFERGYGTMLTPDGLARLSRYSIASEGTHSVSANSCAFIQ